MTATFEAEWDRCAPWLQAALNAGGNTHGLADVKAMVERRDARLWAGRRAAMVTTISDCPNVRLLQLWLAGGELDELVDELRPAAERWAATEQGCTRVMIFGRPGWARLLRDHGYGETARIVEKDLTR